MVLWSLQRFGMRWVQRTTRNPSEFARSCVLSPTVPHVDPDELGTVCFHN